jgi:transposase-like protein
MNITKPKPRRERLRVESLKPNPQLQHRHCADGKTFDEKHVVNLLELYESGVEFGALEVVEEKVKNKEPLYHIIDGMNRHEVYRRAEVPSAECLIYPGTFADALLWSLASNSEQKKARTPEECWDIFKKLIDSKSMLAAVIEERSKHNGTERAIAHATGLGHGTIGVYLRRAGFRVDRLSGKLCPADGPASPERDARQQLVEEATANGATQKDIAKALGVCPNTVREDQRAKKVRPKTKQQPAPEISPARATSNAPAQSQPEPEPPSVSLIGGDVMLNAAIAEAEAIGKALRGIAGRVDSLLKSKAGGKLRTTAKNKGIPFVVTEKDAEVPAIWNHRTDPLPSKVRTESWPTMAALLGLFAELQNDLASEAAQAGFSRGD